MIYEVWKFYIREKKNYTGNHCQDICNPTQDIEVQPLARLPLQATCHRILNLEKEGTPHFVLWQIIGSSNNSSQTLLEVSHNVYIKSKLCEHNILKICLKHINKQVRRQNSKKHLIGIAWGATHIIMIHH